MNRRSALFVLMMAGLVLLFIYAAYTPVIHLVPTEKHAYGHTYQVSKEHGSTSMYEAKEELGTGSSYQGTNETGSAVKYELPPKPIRQSRIILWYFPPRYLPMDMNDLVPLSACPDLNCFMTRNISFLSESDAVIFSAPHIDGTLPPKRPGQIWIYHNYEPYPFAQRKPFLKPPWSSVFNWTMDFRHDADIVRPFAVLREKAKVEEKNYTAIVKIKTKMLAIMENNCINWKGRLRYVRELHKLIPVDVFGGCGKKLFSRQKNNRWLEYLSSNYKFYLGFEHLHCKDYISAKFFNNFNLDLVTVARGGGNYSRDVPPGTFINAADYKTPRDLAKHLLYLSKNNDKYIDILRKKDRFYYETEEYLYKDRDGKPFLDHYYEKQPLCQLCRRLKNGTNYSKTIQNITPWFQEGICRDNEISEKANKDV